MKGLIELAKATKRNWEIAEMLMREYPKVEKYFWESEECEHYRAKKCNYRKSGCKYCQNHKIQFNIPLCKLGKGYDYDGTLFGGEADPEIVTLMNQYPELFDKYDCADCCGCAGW